MVMNVPKPRTSVVAIVAVIALSVVLFVPSAASQHTTDTLDCAVIVSVGRSGSTLLANILQQLPSSFGTLEPYRNHVKAPRSFPLVPLGRLLDCSAYAEQQSTKNVVWDYPCRFNSILKTEQPYGSCRRGLLNAAAFQKVNQACTSATFRFVKTIRLRDSQDLVFPDSCTSQQVVHLMRSPWHVALSLVRLGWVTIKDQTNQTILDALSERTERMCQFILRDRAIIQEAQRHNANLQVQTVRYPLFMPENSTSHTDPKATVLEHLLNLLRFVAPNTSGKALQDADFVAEVAGTLHTKHADFRYKLDQRIDKLTQQQLEAARTKGLQSIACKELHGLAS
eukprot:m.365142 g.365142  ORF g.365142 m.365142 type:complete len:338 (+) comp30171_c0_seq1:181-1194(+)